MKTLLIIYPHFPPSNLAGVHRARLIANFLHEYGWKAIVLTVAPEYYEEALDWDLCKAIRPEVEVIHVKASKPMKIRFFGDIALRAFKSLIRKAVEISKEKKIDFIWAPIPSYYNAVIARRVHDKTHIPYSIDYIDPWVNGFVNFNKVFSRAWLSNQIAKILEPYSVKKTSFISGVSTPYYEGVLDRNFKFKPVLHAGMPYGFDLEDYKIQIENIVFPWAKDLNQIPLVYAGAFLPKSHLFIQLLFKNIALLLRQNKIPANIHLYFLGTTFYSGKTIQDYAIEYGIQNHVTEIHERYPYLHILNFLSASSGVMIVGSTEKHYTASKTFQALLSQKPVFAILHAESTAVEILRSCNADQYLVHYEENSSSKSFEEQILVKFESFLNGNSWNPKLNALDKYSARKSAWILVEMLELSLMNRQ